MLEVADGQSAATQDLQELAMLEQSIKDEIKVGNEETFEVPKVVTSSKVGDGKSRRRHAARGGMKTMVARSGASGSDEAEVCPELAEDEMRSELAAMKLSIE